MTKPPAKSSRSVTTKTASRTKTLPPPAPSKPAKKAKAAPSTPAEKSAPSKSKPPRPKGKRTTKGSSAVAKKISEQQRQVEELVEICEAELKNNPPHLKSAKIHFEIGQAYDITLSDSVKALEHYRQALGFAGNYLPAIRNARRLLLSQQKHTEAIGLYDAEIKASKDAQRKAQLHLAKGRVFEDLLNQMGMASKSYAQAVALDPGNPSALKAMAQAEAKAGSWSELVQTYERAAQATVADAKHRAALIAKRARICETRLKKIALATDLYKTAYEHDQYADGVLEALKRLLHGQSRWRDLIDVLEREITHLTDPAAQTTVLFRVARIFSEYLGDKDKAIAALLRAAKISPDDPLVLDELARLYESTRDFKSVVHTLQRLAETIRRPQERLSLLHRIGQTYESVLDDKEVAVQWYEAAVTIDPTYLPAVQALEKLYTQREKWESLCQLRLREAEAVEDGARRSESFARVADILETRLNQPVEAAKYHTLALNVAPEREASFKALVRLFTQARRFRELVTLYENAVTRATSPELAATYLFNIGDLYERDLADPKQAMDAYKRILNHEADQLRAIHAVQRSAETAGLHHELIRALELEIDAKKDPERAKALLFRVGEVLEDKLDDKKAAIDKYNQVLKLDSTYIPALTRLGRLYDETGRFEDLLDTYRQELAVTPKNAAKVALLQKMGELCEQKLGNARQAIDFYRQALAIDPGHGPIRIALERRLLEKGQFDDLIGVLRGALKSCEDPKLKSRMLYQIAEIYEMHLQNPTLATQAYEQSAAQAPEHRAAWDGSIRTKAQLQKWNELASQLKQQGETVSDPRLAVDALMTAGMVFADHLSQPQEAIAMFNGIVEKHPDNLAAILSLEPLYRKTGQWPELSAIYDQQQRIFSDNGAKVAAINERVRLYERYGLGKPSDVQELYLSVLALNQQDVPALLALEQLAIENGDRALLAQVDGQLMQIGDDPETTAMYRTRLGRSIEATRASEARAAHLAALTADPENLSAIVSLKRLAVEAKDHEGMAEAARRLADWTKRDDLAGDLLVQSGTIRLEKLKNPQSAAGEYALALERCPEHRDAAKRLTALLLESGDVDSLVDILSKAARAAGNLKRQTELWRFVANLHAEKRNDLTAAIATLNQLLQKKPNHLSTMQQLASLYEQDAQWAKMAGVLRRIVALNPPDKTMIDARYSLARVCAERLDDPNTALTSLEALLRINGQHKKALTMQLELRYQQGEIKSASVAAERLLEVTQDRHERAHALLRLGQLALSAGHKKKAVKPLREAVTIAGPQSPAAAEYKPLLGKEESYENYAKVLIAHHKEIEQGNAHKKNSISTVYELASVQHEHLGKSDAAIATLQEGIKLLGGPGKLRYKLGELLLHRDHNGLAADEFQQLVREDPSFVKGWRALAWAYNKQGSSEKVALSLAPLAVLGQITDQEQKLVDQYPSLTSLADSGSFDGEALAPIVIRPREEAEIAALLTSLEDALVKLYPANFEAYGVTRRDRLDEDHPLASLAAQLALVFGVEGYDIYQHSASIPTVKIELGQTISIMVPDRIAGLPEPQQVFALSRVFASMARGVHLATRLGARRTDRLLTAAAFRVDPEKTGRTAHFAADELRGLAKQLVKATPRRNRKSVDEIATRYAEVIPVDSRQCIDTLERTSTRAAALLAGDLPLCTELLREEDANVTALSGAALVDHSITIKDILGFWTSKPALELRERAGIL